ncbi:MAG TPA: STAS/SEC14 domain-containing protein [Polyangiaceae bacterium]|nr:STAS/SEC14 domain-containing protein [Polyangiaceae bacterium]
MTWDADVKCVELRFRGYIEGDELRAAALSVLKLLETHRASKVLTDSRDLRALTQEDQRWIDVEWTQKAKSTGLAYNAVVLPKSAIAKMSVAAVMKKIPNQIEFAYFASVEEARAWLRSK